MKIEAEWKDKFPKKGLDGKYIGDKGGTNEKKGIQRGDDHDEHL